MLKNIHTRKLTLSNSTLEVYFLPPNLQIKISISLDRIRITGKFHPELITNILMRGWKATKYFDNRPAQFQLLRDSKEVIATLNRNDHQLNNWSIDTSNHIKTSKEKKAITEIIKRFIDPHITRIDIALDFKSNSSSVLTRHKIYKSNMKETIHKGKNKELECIEYGGARSNVKYRYYDKLKEQRSKKINVPDVQSWYRLELQVRGNKSMNWFEETIKMLDYFKGSKLEEIKKEKYSRYAILKALSENNDDFQYLSKRTKTKYKKMINDNYGFTNELANQAKDILLANKKRLDNEIKSFL